MKSSKGITLIALVITIIILMILAGVSINLVFGQNGLIIRVKESKILQTKADILEQLELAKAPVTLDGNGYTDLQKYLDYIEINNLGKYKITKIERNEDKVNSTIWVDREYKYTAAQVGNDVIINTEGYITNVDETSPNEAIVKLSSTTAEVGQSITATVTLIDNESGVDISKCKWVYNTTSTNIGTDESKYTDGTFEENPQTITLTKDTVGTYYLHVLTTDNVGNVKETISETVTIKSNKLVDNVSVGDYVAYDTTKEVTDTSKLKYISYAGTDAIGTGNGYGTQQFTANSNIKWIVFSKNESSEEIVLISESPIQTDSNENFYLQGAKGYLYAEQELNEICKIYGYGYGAKADMETTYNYGFEAVDGKLIGSITSGARSMNIDDVINIRDLTPASSYGQSNTHTTKYPTISVANGKSTSKKTRTDITNAFRCTKIGTINDAQKYNIIKSSEFWLASKCITSEMYMLRLNVQYYSSNSVYHKEPAQTDSYRKFS